MEQAGVHRSGFLRDLRWALQNLYDPEKLRTSPLLERFGLEPQTGPAALRRLLTRAIEALQPDATAAPQSSAWRTYKALYHRYLDQFSQLQVAMNLGLSIRQMRRQEGLALSVLADHLLTQYGVVVAATVQAPEPRAADAPSAEQELQWLQKTQPNEAADAAELLASLLRVVEPLANSHRVRLRCDVPDGLPRLAVQVATLRQVLLGLLTAAIRSAAGGAVVVWASLVGRRVRLQVRPERSQAPPDRTYSDRIDNLDMMKQLIELSGSTLVVNPGASATQPFLVELSLPVAEQAAVLVIDDNVDTLQLFQRYLAGTRYPFVGTRDPQAAVTMAAEIAPRVIILDVMLPGIDGWELLGRLREHPATRAVPVIVCSILPQEQLALSLGAAAFLPKPVTRPALLEALDRQLARP